ncbi:MAG: hypothetical protein QNJ15_00520 [Erythrobacter sp.]|nr:hypothetical protein [Erythrobacter sp.]
MRNHNKIVIALLSAALCSMPASAGAGAEESPAIAAEVVQISPGDAGVSIDISSDYRAEYSSAFAKAGAFTLLALRTGDGKTLMLADIIPTGDTVIVSQRHLDLPSMRVKFVAGPFLAWGTEFVVTASAPSGQAWARVPIGPGEVKSDARGISTGGFFSDMYSPLLAALMPRPPGTVLTLPASYPRADETFTIEFDRYEVMGREALGLQAGFECECWKIEKQGWDGSTEHIWVDRKAPYVFKRVRNPGSDREFVSELVAFETVD